MATEYWVNQKVLTSGAGGENDEFKTIQEANAVVVSGDTIYIRSGVYYSQLVDFNTVYYVGLGVVYIYDTTKAELPARGYRTNWLNNIKFYLNYENNRADYNATNAILKNIKINWLCECYKF